MTTKNDVAWRELFIANNIMSDIRKHGISYVTADSMKKYREPRLMAKIDTSELLPQIFKSNELSILPVKNGEYAIFRDPKNQSFYNFPQDFNLISVEQHRPAISISDFDSFENLDNLNEAQALDTALISSIIKDFTNEQNLWLTIRGRHFTRNFKVFIPSINQHIHISRVQIEIDAGYESENAIYIFEAKIGRRENFNIRQLLYPYLEWSNRTSKQIFPIFFIFTNGYYYLSQFKLRDSLEGAILEKQACYTLAEYEKYDFENVIKDASLDYSLVQGVPFPQANDLDKVIDTVSLVNQGYENKGDLSEIFEFDERQGDYYGNAARFIGILGKDKDNNFIVTEEGEKLLKLSSPSKRAKYIVALLVKRPVFHQLIKSLLQKEFNIEVLDTINISEIITENTNLTGSTPPRRASTVRQWMKWILQYAK